jgi:hypothetical protein
MKWKERESIVNVERKMLIEMNNLVTHKEEEALITGKVKA